MPEAGGRRSRRNNSAPLEQRDAPGPTEPPVESSAPTEAHDFDEHYRAALFTAIREGKSSLSRLCADLRAAHHSADRKHWWSLVVTGLLLLLGPGSAHLLAWSAGIASGSGSALDPTFWLSLAPPYFPSIFCFMISRSLAHDVARVQDEMASASYRLAQTQFVLTTRDERALVSLVRSLEVDRNGDVEPGKTPKELLRSRRVDADLRGAIMKLVRARENRRPSVEPQNGKRETERPHEAPAKRDANVRVVGGQ